MSSPPSSNAPRGAVGFEPVERRLTRTRIDGSYRDGVWSGEGIPELLARRVDAAPDAIAVVDGDRRYSWADLRREADAAAAGLQSMGVERGDAVILQLPNWWEYLVV